ncbi:GntR family transcriptional regulator [Limnohabitans sp. Rim8]|uniref:GntR family transcriptional regulator n=1 Tax=Limnohabitans sp. Rim8 TaxID=1100718 RepID=UPI00330613E1
MRLNPPSFKPLYQQVVDALRDEILRGKYPVGGQLPTEGELSERFSVSRHTVREALRNLRSDGLVSSRQGAGTTVARPSAPSTYVQEIESINDLIQYAASIRYKVDRSEVIAADAALAASIGGISGQKWLRIEGLRYEDNNNKPVCRTVVYVHTDFAGVGRLVGRRNSAIYELIEDLYGEKIAEVEQVINAYRVPEVVAAELALEPDAVIVEVRRTYRTVARKIAEVAVNQYPADRFSLAMKLRRRT